MGCTGNNTLAINRPSMNNMASMQCNSTCSELGHADPLNKRQLGPRKQREKVREQIKDYCLHMLGAPVVKLELDSQNLDFAVDQAMKVFEDYAGRELRAQPQVGVCIAEVLDKLLGLVHGGAQACHILQRHPGVARRLFGCG